MKKKLAALLLGVCMTVTLAGCQKSIEDDNVKISEYKGIKVEGLELAKVTDKDVENSIQSTLEAEAEHKEVTDRATKKGDSLEVSYVGKADGETFDQGDLTVEVGGEGFVEGFSEGMEGHKLNETFDISLTLPENYPAEIAGKDAVFTVTINSITEEILPELNDEFVQKISDKAKTVDEYKKQVKKDLETSNKKTVESQNKNSAWTEVVKNTELKKEFKEDINESVDLMKEQYTQLAEMYYQVTFEEFLEQSGITEDQFVEKMEKQAKDQLKSKYASKLIAEKEKLELSDKAYKEKYDESAFQDDLEPLSEDEVEAMDQNGDGEMAVADESDLEQQQDSEGAAGSGDTDGSASSDAADSQSEKKLDENGTYTDKDEVAQYIYEYGHVPSNLTAADYDNADSMLPVEEGVTYQQCSLDDAGKQKLIFTQDAKRIYYTDDDGQSFDEIY